MKLIFVLLLVLVLPARGAVFDDEGLQRLFDEGRADELMREARQRGGPEALAAESLAFVLGGDARSAVAAAERCVDQGPSLAACHFALASGLVLQGDREGLLRGVRVAGRVRDAYIEALRLQPHMSEARLLLHLSYVALPGWVGGSAEKARRLEQEAQTLQPELARVLRARSAMQAQRWAEAERELLAMRPGSDRSLQNALVWGWAALAKHWNKTNDHATARQRLEALVQQLPALAEPVYLLARAHADAGRYEEAIRQLERARGLVGAARLPLDYRIGIAWQDLGQGDKARFFLGRFVSARQGSSENLKDAVRRLKELG